MEVHFLLADENIPGLVIEGLRQAGQDILSIRSHSPGINDHEVLRLARETGRTLLTFDGDFGEIIFSQQYPAPPRVLYLRFFPVDRGEVLSAALRAIEDVPRGYFAVIEPESTRLRQLRYRHG